VCAADGNMQPRSQCGRGAQGGRRWPTGPPGDNRVARRRWPPLHKRRCGRAIENSATSSANAGRKPGSPLAAVRRAGGRPVSRAGRAPLKVGQDARRSGSQSAVWARETLTIAPPAAMKAALRFRAPQQRSTSNIFVRRYSAIVHQ